MYCFNTVSSPRVLGMSCARLEESRAMGIGRQSSTWVQAIHILDARKPQDLIWRNLAKMQQRFGKECPPTATIYFLELFCHKAITTTTVRSRIK